MSETPSTTTSPKPSTQTPSTTPNDKNSLPSTNLHNNNDENDHDSADNSPVSPGTNRYQRSFIEEDENDGEEEVVTENAVDKNASVAPASNTATATNAS